jgi:hypothetical protein
MSLVEWPPGVVHHCFLDMSSTDFASLSCARIARQAMYNQRMVIANPHRKTKIVVIEMPPIIFFPFFYFIGQPQYAAN